MTKHPLMHALAALLYIVVIASGLFYSSGLNIQEPSVLIPIFMLSLLVCSAAIMAFLFFYQPLQLFLEGKKKEAVDFFLKTLAAFALSAAALVAAGLCIQTYLW